MNPPTVINYCSDAICRQCGCVRVYSEMERDFQAAMRHLANVVGNKVANDTGFSVKFTRPGMSASADDDASISRFQIGGKARWLITLTRDLGSSCGLVGLAFAERYWSFMMDRISRPSRDKGFENDRGTVDFLVESSYTSDTANGTVRVQRHQLFRETSTPNKATKNVVFEANDLTIDFSDCLPHIPENTLPEAWKAGSVRYGDLLIAMDEDICRRAALSAALITGCKDLQVGSGDRWSSVSVNNDCSVSMDFDRTGPIISYTASNPHFRSADATELRISKPYSSMLGVITEGRFQVNALSTTMYKTLAKRAGSYDNIMGISQQLDLCKISSVDTPAICKDSTTFNSTFRLLFDSPLMNPESRMLCKILISRPDRPDGYPKVGDLSGFVIPCMEFGSINFYVLQAYRGRYVAFRSPMVWYLFTRNLFEDPDRYKNIKYGVDLAGDVALRLSSNKSPDYHTAPFMYEFLRFPCVDVDKSQTMELQAQFLYDILSSSATDFQEWFTWGGFTISEVILYDIMKAMGLATDGCYRSAHHRRYRQETQSPTSPTGSAIAQQSPTTRREAKKRKSVVLTADSIAGGAVGADDEGSKRQCIADHLDTAMLSPGDFSKTSEPSPVPVGENMGLSAATSDVCVVNNYSATQGGVFSPIGHQDLNASYEGDALLSSTVTLTPCGPDERLNTSMVPASFSQSVDSGSYFGTHNAATNLSTQIANNITNDVSQLSFTHAGEYQASANFAMAGRNFNAAFNHPSFNAIPDPAVTRLNGRIDDLHDTVRQLLVAQNTEIQNLRELVHGLGADLMIVFNQLNATRPFFPS